MLKKDRLLLVLIGFLLFVVFFSSIQENSALNYFDSDNNKNPEFSANLEGIDNIIITKTERRANISSFGLLYIYDTLTFKNLNNNPIYSVFFGIPIGVSQDLIFFEATGIHENTLLAERSVMIMNDFEMIAVYFESPLLPQQESTIKFTHIYKDISTFSTRINAEGNEEQLIILITTVYPLIPYKMENEIAAIYFYPKTGSQIEAGWGFIDANFFSITYNFEIIKDDLGIDHIAPFLENLEDKSGAVIFYTDLSYTKLEIEEINREIFISPWGIIKVKEQISIKNSGYLETVQFQIRIPNVAKNLYVYDSLSEIQGVGIRSTSTPTQYLVDINLFQNRVLLIPNSTFTFNVEYNLPFENYISLNWFQQSIQLDLLTTTFQYLGKKQTINVIIDGCYSIDSVTMDPNAIKTSKGNTILTYESDFVNPIETEVIQIIYTINFFDLLLRPIIFIILISVIASLYILIVKTRKSKQDITALPKDLIPINEIREFCSLYEEKNALTLEIRQTEEDAKRKKIAKKKYKNILNKNTSKIDEIQVEITPFKKIVMNASETFENIVKRLDVLEAERISVKDSLTLLESRYKRGRLPSRAAYLKLSDDFKKRSKKIDRTIDKFIQQLRSYLL